MFGHYRLVLGVDKVSLHGLLKELAMNVGLIFLDIGFSRQHARGRCVVGGNVNHGQGPTRCQETVRFPQHALASVLWGFVERVHDGDQIERFGRQWSVFGIGNEKFGGGIAGALTRGVSALLHGLIRVLQLVCGLLEPRLHHGQVSGQKLGHADHFWRRVNSENGFGFGKGILQSARGHANTATEIGDARIFVAHHFRQLLRQYFAHVLTVIGSVVNQLGRERRDGGVQGAEKSRIAKDVNLWLQYDNIQTKHSRQNNLFAEELLMECADKRKGNKCNCNCLPDH